MAGAPAAPEHRQALAFERGYYARAARQAVAHPLGMALRDDRFPRAHMLNQLWVTEPTGATADALLAALEALQAHVPDRVAFVEDDALGAALAPALRAAGFTCEAHLYMALRRPRDRAPAPGLAREAGEEEFVALTAAVTREYPHGAEEGVVRDLVGARAALRAAVPRALRIAGPAEGAAVASVTLLCGDGVAQLEDVATLEAFRGRGLARAVCSHALEAAADAELTFLVADADDWPRQLYAKLGFDPVGTSWAMTRMGEPQSSA